MLGSLLAAAHLDREPRLHRGRARADRRAHRDGDRARLPVEPGHQLRGRRPRRPRGGAARGHGRARRTGRTGRRSCSRSRAGHARRDRGRARGDPPAVQGAARDRARRDDRRRRAGPRGHADACPTTGPAQLQTAFPSPITGRVARRAASRSTGPQLLVLIVVPVITVGLWWLLGHTRFGVSVRAVGHERRPRPAHRHQPEAGVDRDLDASPASSPRSRSSSTPPSRARRSSSRSDRRRCCSASPPRSIGGMRSFPRAVAGAIGIGVLYQVLVFNFPNTVGLVQFVVLILVLVPRRPDEPRATTPARRASRSRRGSRRSPSGCGRSGGSGACRSSSPASRSSSRSCCRSS